MINNTPYTYLIGWPNLNKWYYGVRYAKNCQPIDLLEVREKKSKYLKENNPVFKEGVREKISKALLGKKRPRKCCEHCKKDIADSIYTKFHGDRCKHRVV